MIETKTTYEVIYESCSVLNDAGEVVGLLRLSKDGLTPSCKDNPSPPHWSYSLVGRKSGWEGEFWTYNAAKDAIWVKLRLPGWEGKASRKKS